MSRIYFHSPSGEVEISGAERAYLGSMTRDFSLAAAGVTGRRGTEEHPLSQFVREKEGYPMRDGILTEEALALIIGTAGHERGFGFEFEGRHWSPWILNLNTALQVGNEAVRLGVQIHAQCECHCYVEGPNRAWMADLITDARERELFRPCEGWEELAAFLRLRDDEPVVCSYSVTEGFPRHGDDWEAGLRKLRAGEFGQGIEIAPGAFDDVHFGEGEKRVT